MNVTERVEWRSDIAKAIGRWNRNLLYVERKHLDAELVSSLKALSSPAEKQIKIRRQLKIAPAPIKDAACSEGRARALHGASTTLKIATKAPRSCCWPGPFQRIMLAMLKTDFQSLV